MGVFIVCPVCPRHFIVDPAVFIFDFALALVADPHIHAHCHYTVGLRHGIKCARFSLSDSHKHKDKYKEKEHKHKDHKKDKEREKSKHGNGYAVCMDARFCKSASDFCTIWAVQRPPSS